MLLNSIYFILLLLTMLTYNIKILLLTFFVLVIAHLVLGNRLWNKIKKVKYIFYIMLMSFLFQLIYNSYGTVVYELYFIKIYSQGVKSGLIVTIKILDMALIAWLINFEKILPGRLLRYRKIIAVVMHNVPVIFTMFKKKKSPNNVFKHILKKIYKEL